MPGSNRAVFLDRDGTIVEDPGYLSKPDQLKLIDGAADAIARLRQAGFIVILATNQSGIARGMMTEDDLAAVHARMVEMLAGANPDARLDAIYYCPFHPEATVPAYKQESYLRKPRPGMLFKAAREHQLDLGSCWMVGDSERDVQAGKTAGCRAVRLDADPETETMADKVLASLADAADLILASPGRTPLKSTRVGEALVEVGQLAQPEQVADENASAGQPPSPAPEAPAQPAAGEEVTAPEAVPAEPLNSSPSENQAAVVQPSSESKSDNGERHEPDASPKPGLGRTRDRLLREIEQDRQRALASPGEPADPITVDKPSRPLDAGNMRQVLAEILQQLRQLNRGPGKAEISTTKILGGLFQMLAWGMFGAAMISMFSEGPGDRAIIWAIASVFMQLASLLFFTMFRSE